MVPDFLRPVLGRIFGSIAGAIAAWLVGKGFTVDQHTIDAFVSVMLFVFTIVYSLVHKAVSAKINPTDAARISTAADSKRRLG